MKIDVEREIRIFASAERVFAFLGDIRNLTTFTGYGPIPAIRHAEYVGNVREEVGMKRVVSNADGTSYHETCIVYEPPSQITWEITRLDRPFSLIVQRVRDTFQLTDAREGTLVTRSLRVELKGIAAYPTAAPLVPFLQKAIELNLQNIRRAVVLPESASVGQKPASVRGR